VAAIVACAARSSNIDTAFGSLPAIALLLVRGNDRAYPRGRRLGKFLGWVLPSRGHTNLGFAHRRRDGSHSVFTDVINRILMLDIRENATLNFLL
jgi:hypothetical protein